MSVRLLPLLILFAAALAPQAAPPATAQSELMSGPATLPTGSSTFNFDNWARPGLKVEAYVPQDVDPATAPILIIMHGQGRDADRYLRQWRPIAQACGFVAIAPTFPRRDFATSRQYNLGYLQERGESDLRPRSRWTFAAIEPLFDVVVARLGGNQPGYALYGHSAGSQFVHRFALTQRDTRALRVLAANAGWYTLPTFAFDYPYGLNSTDLQSDDLQAALASDLIVLLGEEDDDPDHRSLNRSEGAMMQGPHRFARGRYFYSFGREMARRQGWDFGWRARFVPGVAHDNAGMASAAGDLVVGVRTCATEQEPS